MAQHCEEPIEVDPAILANDCDDDYASSGYDTSTDSLTSSVQEYIFENGRRYHTYFGMDKNLLPTDEIEQDRLDMHHEIMLRLLSGELHNAPLKDPHRILDVGTGTGIWAIDMADKHPMAEVIGIDLSPIQPRWVPSNCRFEVDDAEQEWTYHLNSFDFIHARNIAQGISDWSKLMAQIYRCIAPGGYVQLAETSALIHCDDGTMTEDNGVKRFFEIIDSGLGKIGRPAPTDQDLRKRVEDAGFVDIKVMRYKQPLGPWPKDKRHKQLGAMIMLNCETAFSAYGLSVFTRILGMNKGEAERICSDALKAIRNKNYHLYNYYNVVVGRKPPYEE